WGTAPAAVAEGTTGVVLDGSRSFDPDGDPITMTWTQVGGTEPVTLAQGGAFASFDAPLVADSSAASEGYSFELAVSDGELTSFCIVPVTISNVTHGPTARAGATQTVDEGAAVTLDASATTDPDGDALAYSWTQIAGPPVTLSDPSSATPVFTAPFVPAGG